MKKYSIISALCAVITLGACDHYSTKLASMESHYTAPETISPAAGGETTFRGYLANEYLELARYENETKQDYRAAKYYTNKAARLNEGEMVSPASFNDFRIEEAKRGELTQARQQLLSALKTYNIPENRAALAKAQSRYDCWMEQLGDQPDDSIPLTCEVEYKQAMASLAVPYDRDLRFAVGFMPDGTGLSEKGKQSLAQVINLYQRNAQNNVMISLLPPTTLTQDEAMGKAGMIKSILEYNGIPAEKINMMVVQDDLLVPKNNFEVLVKVISAAQPLSAI